MSKLTITGRLDGDTASQREAAGGALTRDTSGPAAAAPPPSRLSRLLALAYLVERFIEEGKLRDFAHAARLLGISRARMTQVMNLACLPTQEQERVLMGQASATERAIRRGSPRPDDVAPAA